MSLCGKQSEVVWIAVDMASGARATVAEAVQDHCDVTWQWHDRASSQHGVAAPGNYSLLHLTICTDTFVQFSQCSAGVENQTQAW